VLIVIGVLIVLLVGVFLIGGRGLLGRVIENGSYGVYGMENVSFRASDGKEIHGLFYLPGKENFNVVIVLPGGGGTKESRGFYGEILAREGYGALILDQRGIGETGGTLRSFADDYYAYVGGQEVEQILMAKDVSSAVNFLEGDERVLGVGVLGESMGGRYGIIATGADKRIRGMITISSAGFNGKGDSFTQKYLEIINPNSYIGTISPRRLLMLHALNDSVIPIEDARITFSLAKEPKKFVEVGGKCNHGYCKEMKEYIIKELGEMFK